MNYRSGLTSTLSFLLLLATMLPAQDALGQPADKTLLWKIEGDDIKPSYLLGTIHVMPQSQFELKDKVKTAFAETEQLVLELDIDDPGLQGAIMANAAMEGGETLDKLLPARAYQTIDEQLQALMGVGLAPFNTFKPMLIASFLVAKYVGEQPASFEMTLTQMAAAQEMEILGLETVAEQMEVFDRIAYEDQAADLVEMIDDETRTKAMFGELFHLYQMEDQAGLYTMMGEYFDDPSQLDVMIIARNKSWISRMVEKASEKSTFFGVGAGHLGGEQGVLKLLKEAGYTLTPIM